MLNLEWFISEAQDGSPELGPRHHRQSRELRAASRLAPFLKPLAKQSALAWTSILRCVLPLQP